MVDRAARCRAAHQDIYMLAKAIFLAQVPMTASFEAMLPIGYLRERRLDVEYCDLSRVLYPELGHVEGSIEGCYIRRMDSSAQFDEYVTQNARAVFFLHIRPSPLNLRVFETLAAHGAHIVFISWGCMPSIETRLWQRLRRAALRPGTTFRNQLTKILSSQRGVGHFNASFYSGTASRDSAPPSDAYVATNLPDYEQYQTIAQSMAQNGPSGRFAVFLDCAIPFHPDALMIGAVNPDAAPYQRAMMRLFERVELATGSRVIVAAHPKAKYPPAFFGDREMVAGRTAELVLRSRLVISHYSTSTSYAVMARKPILFAYSNAMDTNRCGYSADHARAFSRELGAKCINVDARRYDVSISAPDEERYRAFYYRYVTSPECERRSNGEVFLSYLDTAVQ